MFLFSLFFVTNNASFSSVWFLFTAKRHQFLVCFLLLPSKQSNLCSQFALHAVVCLSTAFWNELSVCQCEIGSFCSLVLLVRCAFSFSTLHFQACLDCLLPCKTCGYCGTRGHNFCLGTFQTPVHHAMLHHKHSIDMH